MLSIDMHDIRPHQRMWSPQQQFRGWSAKLHGPCELPHFFSNTKCHWPILEYVCNSAVVRSKVVMSCVSRCGCQPLCELHGSVLAMLCH